MTKGPAMVPSHLILSASQATGRLEDGCGGRGYGGAGVGVVCPPTTPLSASIEDAGMTERFQILLPICPYQPP